MKPPETVNTSPQTPRFVDEPWRQHPPPPLPADVQAALEALKARLHTGGGIAVVPQAEQAYLAACATRPTRETS